MADVVRWDELTPAAQAVMREELDELLELAPNKWAVALTREQAAKNPKLIPHLLESLRAAGIERG